jgi:3-isopropylmalate/(R)-2-methylmalate dehydratase large subunit
MPWRSSLPHTLAEKILLAHSDVDELRPGDVVTVRCDVVMANDVSGPVAFRAMERMGASRVFDPERVVMVADHFVPAKDARSAELQRRLETWSREQGVVFYGQGRGGIEHTLLCEEGWVTPGSVIAGGDSHTCTYGALGSFGTGLGSTDIASCLALGSFWQQVPETIAVELEGSPAEYVTGKDVILAVLAEIGVGGGTNAVLEFRGPGAEALSLDERLAVANMAVEAGAETGIFPADESVREYLEGRARWEWRPERSDDGAELRQRLSIELSSLEPLVALPQLPGNVRTVSEAAGVRVDQVYIGNCANGTLTDLRQAASILAGRSVDPGTRAIVVPATQAIWREAAAAGLLDTFVEAGVMVSTPTCGACFGGSNGVLAAGETAVATTNRNFRGRMGSPEAQVYLANAWVAAAAAVAGELVHPRDVA